MVRQLVPNEIETQQIDIWSEDEARVGQQGSLCRIWAKRGTRPRKVKQRQFISTYLYAAACHSTGESCALILPCANTDMMNIFLKELSDKIASDRHAALIIDQAGWHIAHELQVPSNITLIPLPPYSPELNGVEQIWEWLRNHHFSNQCYKNYEHIVESVSTAWNEIAFRKDLIKSIISRKWIKLP